ncbi:MAG: CpaF family protein [Candidatus Micrarchaeota archaeon]|nr:CpaF family protein [Candidatus Micrarchaeota archaeon]
MEAETQPKTYATYKLDAHGIVAEVKVYEAGGFIPRYDVTVPGLGDATKILLLSLRHELLTLVPIDPSRINDPAYIAEVNKKYLSASNIIIDKYLPGTKEDVKRVLIAYITNVILGLGDLEVLLADDNLEEIAVNGSRDYIWVFHKLYGWCKTNLKFFDEDTIYNDAEQIGRRVGRQISNLTPLMDAELTDGSRVNATLFPVSQHGNTITIRKFSKNPWTIPALIANKTVSPELASMIWLCIQNEISMLISGGTASGKTSFLNAISIFMPAARRVISVEETRELTLPEFLQWVPMLTRQPNPEGKGEITLYHLMINALRQRPDIMLVGEIRTKPDAETLFEAIHTGHAVYGTIHADNAQDTIIRMVNPPMDIPKIMMNSIGGIISLFRHRRLGIRRVFEFGEIQRSGDASVIYRWNMRADSFVQVSGMSRLAELLTLYGGYTKQEIDENIKEKVEILSWMTKNNVFDVDSAGTVVANYYKDPNYVLDIARKGLPYSRDVFKVG